MMTIHKFDAILVIVFTVVLIFAFTIAYSMTEATKATKEIIKTEVKK